MRIDSEDELMKFFHELEKSNIEIPYNLTFEIESKHLKVSLLSNIGVPKEQAANVPMLKGEYMGRKIHVNSGK